ncbi:DUF4193 family protein [Georgenia yuyongxinii]
MMDYDRRRSDFDPEEDLESPLPAIRRAALASVPEQDVEEAEFDDPFEGFDPRASAEDLVIRVLPVQRDEFVCSLCSLVHHRSQQAVGADGRPVHVDCA